MSLLVLGDVSATYRDGAAETKVLHGLDLVLQCNETTSLMGRSGSGKSTLLGVIAGLIRPASGSIAFDGIDVSALDEDGWGRLRAERIGYVLQGGNLVPFLTVAENVELALQFVDRRGGRRRATALLGQLGLGHRREHYPRQLSGGEAQRVAVAIAMVNEPDLLLADEVTGELDTASADAVMRMIFDAAASSGMSVLFVTHSGELAAQASRRLLLAGGKAVAA